MYTIIKEHQFNLKHHINSKIIKNPKPPLEKPKIQEKNHEIYSRIIKGMHISIIDGHNAHHISQEIIQNMKILTKNSLWPKISITRNQSKFLISIHNVGVIESQNQYYNHLRARIEPLTSLKSKNHQEP